MILPSSAVDDVRRPAGGAADHKDGGEHGGGDAQHVIAGRAVPIQIWEHLLFAPHHLLDTRGDVEQLHIRRIV
jgi:hypothetical protein